MKRVLLFITTNLAIILVLGVVLSLLGVDSILDEQGIGLDLQKLLVLSVVYGMGGSFISLALSKWSAKRMMGAQVIQDPRGQAELWLMETVGKHAQASGIAMPEVAIYDSPEPNAFATGARRDHALVAVSTGLLRGMTKDEIDAVLAHEVSHVANGDMVTLALVQGVVNVFVIFIARVVGHVIDRVVLRNEQGHGLGYLAATIAAQVLLGILASPIVMWFSRQREFRADAGAARLAGANRMVAALERLKGGSGEPLPDQLGAFGISGGVKGGLASLFASHPPLDERIARLRAQGG